MTAENDSSDLEALFDSIAESVSKAPPPAPAAPAGDDNDELQALFDSVSKDYVSPAPAVATPPPAAARPAMTLEEGLSAIWPAQEAVFNRVGHMARQLHDTIHELGYDKLLEKTASALPDAKDRLAYVANLTEQAACRVLNATDVATPMVEEIERGAKSLGQRWDRAFSNQLSVDEFRQLAIETRNYLNKDVQQRTLGTKEQLTEIMMAQDFQDLTGQVIKKIVNLAQELEAGLMNVLLEVVPDTRRTDEVNNLMNGPVVNSEGRSDVVVNQSQVDELLESLGF